MASAKRKERTLDELYSVTAMITEPKITPVLRGSCRMQGPVDETDDDIQSTMVFSRDTKGMGRNSKSRKVIPRAESGTCNVCSAPCSSCLHINRALPGVKTEESSDETCQQNAGSQYSATDVPVKSSTCDSEQRTASETSNIGSVNSNYDTVYGNVESKASLRTCDVSGVSDDVERHPTSSPGGTAECLSDKRALRNKFEERKGLEGREDSTSCVTGGSEAKILASHNTRSVDVPHGLDELSPHKKDLIENPCLEEKSDGVGSSKLLSAPFYPSGGKCISSNSNVKNLDENLGSHLLVGVPERAKPHLSLSLSNEAAPNLVPGQGAIDHSKHDGGNAVALEEVCLKSEAEAEINTETDNEPTEVVNSAMLIKEIEKAESCGLPDMQETDLQSQPMVDTDESDVLEHDVKVCDICGDAGREDLLAICSRCSDGAEHTYCMREMTDKVPEGDWLCEECKSCDEIKKEDKIVALDGFDKYQSSGVASDLDTNLFITLNRKDLDAEGNKSSKNISGRKDINNRPAEYIVPSVAKKQALGPTVESSKACSPSRVASLTRESSFRNLDKGELKPPHQLSSATCSISDTPEAVSSPRGPRPQTARGPLFKSSSFSTNAKPKVEICSEEVPQKQKVAREPSYSDKKEGPTKLIGRSMSFKPVNPGRLNPSESKVKMLSPNFSHPQDLKGLRQAKAQSLLERRSSFRSERPLVSTTMGSSTVSIPNADQRLASTDPLVSNNSELKGVQVDSKLSTLSKSTSHAARKGEVKKQSCLSSVAGALASNGISSSAEQKPNETCLGDDSSSSTHTAEKPFCNLKGALPGVLPRPQETNNPGERESSVSRPRPSVAIDGKNAPCQKCKESGHSAQFCTVDSPRCIATDASAARSSEVAMSKGSKLKAAIEAAMLKKPGICRKNKMADQADDLSMPSTNVNCEIHPKDQLSNLSKRKNTFSDVLHEGQAVLQNINSDPSKQATVNNLDQFSLPFEAVSLKTDGKLSMEDLSSQASATVSVLFKMPVVPEHEYIWQGGFEVHRSGKLAELRDGVQAHLSTCVSPKVLEVVNKFPSKVLLNEVPRLSTWPIQFQESGVKEDNIALYFFAKDLESYERSYKSSLETMMKRDLALKANFDGVELLIFPSNHLPQNAQRWNMLYFLWGVFRGKKVHCLRNVSCSPKKLSFPSDVPTTRDGDLPDFSKACNASLASDIMDLPGMSKNVTTDGYALASLQSECHMSDNVKGECDTKASPGDPNGQCLQGNVAKQDGRLDAKGISGLSSEETEDNLNPRNKLDVKFQPSIEDAAIVPSNVQQRSSSSGMPPVERTLKEEEESTCAKSFKERNMMRDGTMKELNKWQFNHRKRLREDPIPEALDASISSSCITSMDNSFFPDGGGANKKQKTGSAVMGMYDNGITAAVKEKSAHTNDKREVLKNNGTAERYFYPVDANPVKEFIPGGNSLPWKVTGSADYDMLLKRVPNVDLDVEGEIKPAKPGISLDLNEAQDYDYPPDNPAAKEKGGDLFDLNIAQDYPPDNPEAKEVEGDDSALLSLSLSFPFPDKEPSVKPVSKMEQDLSDRRHAKSSFLLFNALSKK